MSFTHRTEGTAEAEWLEAIARHDPVELQEALFAEIDHLVVVAAHPDDETLGAAGLLARAYAAGVRTTVVVATSGEGSHPDSSTHRPDELARLRETETTEAVALMAPGATVEFLRLPDGGLGAAADALRDGVDAAVGAGDARLLLVSTWAGDRHPDHEAACEAAAHIARARGAWHLAFPVWLWHWAGVEDPEVPWESFVSVALDPEIVDAKLHALARHASQVSPLSGLPGDEVLLHEGMLEHFVRPFELFIDLTPSADRADADADVGADADLGADAGADVGGHADGLDLTTAPAELHDREIAADYFDRLHAGADDPWGFESRWYEERKRALLVASLPDRRYGTALEIGCSTGVLSAALLQRTTDRFVGVDISQVAIDRARVRAAGTRGETSPVAEFHRMPVPAEWPGGRFDLVVVSEVGYYLDAPDLGALIDRILATLTDSGAVVVCHWRHPVAGRSGTGDGVHAAFLAEPRLDRLVHHLEEDFVLDVFTRTPAVSVARREGIL